MKYIIAITLFLLTSLSYASEQIKIIVPSAAGGFQHRIALFLQKSIQEEYTGKNVVVITKPGGDGAVGLQEVVNDNSDNVFFLTGMGILQKSTNVPTMMENIKKLKPSILMFETHFVLITEDISNVKTFKELEKMSKTKPLNIGGSLAIGTYIAEEVLKSTTNTSYVTYNSDAQVMMALKSKTIDAGVITYPSSINRKDFVVILETDVKGLKKAGIKTNKMLMTQHGLWASPKTSEDNTIIMNRMIRNILMKEKWRNEIHSWNLKIYDADQSPEGLLNSSNLFLNNFKK